MALPTLDSMLWTAEAMAKRARMDVQDAKAFKAFKARNPYVVSELLTKASRSTNKVGRKVYLPVGNGA